MANMIEIILKAIDKASGPISSTTRSLGDLENKAERVHNKLGPLNNLLGTGLKVAATTAAAGIIALGAGLTSSVLAAADMEQGVADIAAVMGLASNEVEPLAKLIDQLGIDPKLKVDATEAADAIEMLAKNGVTMADIMDGAARNTVLLANATGADFSTAADVATDAMALFGIKAKDMKTAVDGISAVTITSKFDMNDYALALAQAGGVASAVGVEFDDFNAVIAAISPYFASGSDAGTSFKVLLQRLIPQSAAAVDAMRELGLFTGLTKKEFEDTQEKIFKYQNQLAMLDPTSKNYAERAAELQQKIQALQSTLVTGSNAFFDSNGNMKSAAEIAGILHEALSGLSEEQKNQALSTIFGTDAMRAAAAMAGITEDEFLALKATMGKVDAEEQAATRMNTLRGSLEILQGVFDSLKLQIGDKFIPVFKGLVDQLTDFLSEHGPGIVAWAGEMANKLGALIERYLPVFLAKVKEWVNNAPQFVGQFQNAAKQAGELLSKFIEIAAPIAKFILEGNNLKAVLIALGAVMAVQAVASIVTFVGSVVGAISAMASFVAGLGLAVPALGAVLTAIGPVIAIAAALGAAVYALWLAWDKNFLGIRDITQNALNTISGWLRDFPNTMTNFANALGEKARQAMESLRNGFVNAQNWVRNGWDLVMDALNRGRDERMPQWTKSLYDAGTAGMGKLREGMAAVTQSAKDQLQKIMSDVKDHGYAYATGAFAGRIYEGARDGLKRFTEGLNATAPTLKSDMERAINGVKDAFNGVTNGFSNHIRSVAGSLMRTLGEGLAATNIWGTAEGAFFQVIDAFNGIMDSFREHVWSVMINIGGDIAKGMARGIRDAISQVTEALNFITNYAPQWVKDRLGIRSPSAVFADIAKWIPPGMAEGIMETASQPLDALNRVMQDMTAGVAGLAALPSQAMASGEGGVDTRGGYSYDNSRTVNYNIQWPGGGQSVQRPDQVGSLLDTLGAIYAT